MISSRPLLALSVSLGIGILHLTLPAPSVTQAVPDRMSDPPPSTWYNCLTREVWSSAKQAWCESLQVVQNLTYRLPDYGEVPLQAGRYTSPEQSGRAELINRAGFIQFGDLTGMGTEDAVVLLELHVGDDAGQLTYLVPVLNVMTNPQPLAPIALGDRGHIQALHLTDSTVAVTTISPATDNTVPSAITQTYQLQPTLVPVANDLTSALPFPGPQLDSPPNSQFDRPDPTAQELSVPDTATIVGTVSYYERLALHPDALVEVELVDISADGTGTPLASQTIPLQGRQVPVPFTLIYDPMDLQPGHSYTVNARITVHGGLRFTGTQPFPLPTDHTPTTLNVLVQLAWGRLGR